MASNALKQLIVDASWGPLDYLLIDLPPGTSDIHLTLMQTVPVTGAVIVTTPQEVALADVIKGVNMFRGKSVDVPVLGIVENMAWFTPEELPNNKYYLFGHEGGKRMAEKLNMPLLGKSLLFKAFVREETKGSLQLPVEIHQQVTPFKFWQTMWLKRLNLGIKIWIRHKKSIFQKNNSRNSFTCDSKSIALLH
jgi:hypothetical protein